MDDFGVFLAENFETVRRAVALALGDADRAEDVTQTAFARALVRWPAIATMERPVAWVYVVALNQARRDFREANRAAPSMVARAVPDVAGSVATSVSLRAALATLAPRQRAAVVLRYLADLSVAEVAQALGCAQGTVKSSLHTALNHLRVELDEETEP